MKRTLLTCSGLGIAGLLLMATVTQQGTTAQAAPAPAVQAQGGNPNEYSLPLMENTYYTIDVSSTYGAPDVVIVQQSPIHSLRMSPNLATVSQGKNQAGQPQTVHHRGWERFTPKPGTSGAPHKLVIRSDAKKIPEYTIKVDVMHTF